MKILHLSPTYFHETSVIGGGERYAFELAKAAATREEVVFLAMAKEPASRREENLTVEHLRPGDWGGLLKRIARADVVHAHQPYRMLSDAAIIAGKILGKKVFLTDLGGADRWALSYHLPLFEISDGFILISRYSEALWRSGRAHLPRKTRVIYGGVDAAKFSPGPTQRTRKILFVGRLLPHKGVNYLIDAVNGSGELEIAGTPYSDTYFSLLKSKAEGKNVSFLTGLNDAELIDRYRRSLVTVLPSVYEDCYGAKTDIPELLGLAAIESLACGTPVIVTSVASLPEIVENDVNGFVVPPNDPAAIREKIAMLVSNPRLADEMGRRGREKVLEKFTWQKAAEACLAAYRES